MIRQSCLFEEYPVLEDDEIMLRKMSAADAGDLARMCAQKEVYRCLPTFLYEQKYEDKYEVLARMDEECFDTKQNLLLGVYLKEHQEFAGIAEIYAYEPQRRKCSIGIRLMSQYWGRKLATRAERLMISYLLDEANIRIITAHIMKENKASAAVVLKCGFVRKYPDIWEDWGFADPVLIDKYVIKVYGNLKRPGLYPYQPQLKDLWFRQKLLADEETMSYNHSWGGTVPFPEEDWPSWYDHWIVNHQNQRYYRYLKNPAGDFVGEIAWHYDRQRDIHVANVIIYAPYRGQGYGSEALEILCEKAGEAGIRVLYDDIAIDNPAISLFLKHGFREIYRTDEIIMLGKDLTENDSATEELHLELQDDQWPYEYTDHDRLIVRAIVYDDEGFLYFVRAQRDDEFGKATLIETSGGGVEAGEDPDQAIKRELKEELGAEVEIITRIGVVSDYYNLIHRHNLNNYYLCRVLSFGEKHLMKDEIEDFHLTTLKLTYQQALEEYQKRASTRIGKLIAQREVPVLRRAGQIAETLKNAEGRR